MTSTPNAPAEDIDITILGSNTSPMTRSRRRRHRQFENRTENIPRFELSDSMDDDMIPTEEEEDMDDSAAANFTIFGSREQNKKRRKRKDNTTNSSTDAPPRPSASFTESSSRPAPGMSQGPTRPRDNLSTPFFQRRRPSPPLRPSRRAQGPATRRRQDDIQLFVPRMPNANVSSFIHSKLMAISILS